MKQSEFEKEYTKAEKQIDRIKMVSDALKTQMTAKCPDHAAALSVSLNEEAEKLLRITRQLPMFTGRPEYIINKDRNIADAMDISVGFTEDEWFAVHLPALLPHKKKGDTTYIRDSLIAVMNEYFLENEFFLINSCVVATCYIYDESRSQQQWRDYDNFEYKAALDVLASYVLRDDSPALCSQFFHSFYGSEDSTVIYFIPTDEMDIFLEYIDMEELPTVYID